MTTNLRTVAAADAAAIKAKDTTAGDIRRAIKNGTALPSQVEKLTAMEGARMGRQRTAKEAAATAADHAHRIGHKRTAQRAAAEAAALAILTDGIHEGSDAYEMAAANAAKIAERATEGITQHDRENAYRMAGGAAWSLCRAATREAMESGGRAALAGLPRAEQIERTADLAADLATHLLSAPRPETERRAKSAARRRYPEHHQSGRRVIDYLTTMEREGQETPRWDDAPALTENDRQDIGRGRIGYRAAWTVALKQHAWRLLYHQRQARAAERERLSTPEARAALASDAASALWSRWENGAERIARLLNLRTQETDALILAVAQDLPGNERPTRSTIAEARGTTPGTVKTSAKRGRAALLKRYGSNAGMAEALRVALAADERQRRAQALDDASWQLARKYHGTSTHGRSLTAYLAAVDRMERIARAASWHQATNRLMSAAPSKRATYATRPMRPKTAERAARKLAQIIEARSHLPRAQRVALYLRAVERLAAQTEHKTERAEAAANQAKTIGALRLARATDIDTNGAEWTPDLPPAKTNVHHLPWSEKVPTSHAPITAPPLTRAHSARYHERDDQRDNLAQATRAATENARQARQALTDRTSGYKRTTLAPHGPRAWRDMQKEAAGPHAGRADKATRATSSAV